MRVEFHRVRMRGKDRAMYVAYLENTPDDRLNGGALVDAVRSINLGRELDDHLFVITLPEGAEFHIDDSARPLDYLITRAKTTPITHIQFDPVEDDDTRETDGARWSTVQSAPIGSPESREAQ